MSTVGEKPDGLPGIRILDTHASGHRGRLRFLASPDPHEDAVFRQWQASCLDTLTPQQRDALRKWTTAFHSRIQRQLGGGRLSEEVLGIVWQMDLALISNPLPVDRVLHRCTDLLFFGAHTELELLAMVGAVREATGYLATGVARGTSVRGGEVTLELLAPRGTPGLFISPLAPPEARGQGELLIARKQRYRILEAAFTDDGILVRVLLMGG